MSTRLGLAVAITGLLPDSSAVPARLHGSSVFNVVLTIGFPIPVDPFRHPTNTARCTASQHMLANVAARDIGDSRAKSAGCNPVGLVP